MRIPDLIGVAGKSLLRTKGRAVLTVLGIVIGIASVILMLSIGRAAQNFLLSQVASFGSDLVMVTNGRGDVKRGDPSQTVKKTLTYDDYKQLRQQTWVRLADVNVISSDLLTFGGQSTFGSVVGAASDQTRVFNDVVAKGRFLSDDDLD